MDNNNTDASSCTTTLLCKSFKELFLKTPEQQLIVESGCKGTTIF